MHSLHIPTNPFLCTFVDIFNFSQAAAADGKCLINCMLKERKEEKEEGREGGKKESEKESSNYQLQLLSYHD